MTKKICLYLLFIFAIMIVITGCGESPSRDETKTQIERLTETFANAVEQYNVDGMLACLSGNDFMLTIKEAGQSYSKTYTVLAGELKTDETNQLNWRKSTDEEDGHEYVLELVLDTPQYDNLSSTGGIITRSFKVLESAHGIPQTKTDNGIITWESALISGEWKTTAMTIQYQALTAEGLSSRTISIPRGFGFSKLSF